MVQSDILELVDILELTTPTVPVIEDDSIRICGD